MTMNAGFDASAAETSAAVNDVSALEQADAAVAQAVAPYRHSRTVRLLGWMSEIADQPPLIALCTATLGWGLVSRNPRLARAGARMLASELLATAAKTVVKRSVDRTRPKVLVEEGHYEMHPGDSRGHRINSFPSGHTAGAVTVARAIARDYPEHAAAAYAAAAAIAAIQVPRCTHYPTDIAAGAVVGIASEAIVSAAFTAVEKA
jgi:membrane-associated phospholipid phosphatase